MEPRKLIQLEIHDWSDHGDYMTFAKLVDELKKPIILQATSSTITAFGPEDRLQSYSRLLKRERIGHKFIYDRN